MEQVEHYYLFDCNLHRDIENNIGEVKIPEFSMEHIITIDEKYKKRFEKINKIVYQDISDEQQLIQMTNNFELNELFTEHIQNIEVLIIRMNEYNTIQRRFTSKNKKTIPENPIIIPIDLKNVIFSFLVKKCAKIEPVIGVVLINIAAK